MQTDEDPVVERETIYSHLLHCLPPDLYNHNSQRYAHRLTIGCYDRDTSYRERNRIENITKDISLEEKFNTFEVFYKPILYPLHCFHFGKPSSCKSIHNHLLTTTTITDHHINLIPFLAKFLKLLDLSLGNDIIRGQNKDQKQ